MAAMNMAMIRAMTTDPVFPRTLWMGSMKWRTPHTIPKLIMTATNVTIRPEVCKVNIVAVIAPGPTRRGTPMGTAPMLSGEAAVSCQPPDTRILMAMMKRRIPPAIIKLLMVIPKKLRTSRPAMAKNNRSTKPTKVAVRKALLLSSLPIVDIELPGVKKEAIDLSMHEDIIHVTAEREDLEFHGHLQFPIRVDPTKAKATFANGLLKVQVPLKEKRSPPLKIKVE